jgi:hypothetical protein
MSTLERLSFYTLRQVAAEVERLERERDLLKGRVADLGYGGGEQGWEGAWGKVLILMGGKNPGQYSEETQKLFRAFYEEGWKDGAWRRAYGKSMVEGIG